MVMKEWSERNAMLLALKLLESSHESSNVVGLWGARKGKQIYFSPDSSEGMQSCRQSPLNCKEIQPVHLKGNQS